METISALPSNLEVWLSEVPVLVIPLSLETRDSNCLSSWPLLTIFLKILQIKDKLVIGQEFAKHTALYSSYCVFLFRALRSMYSKEFMLPMLNPAECIFPVALGC